MLKFTWRLEDSSSTRAWSVVVQSSVMLRSRYTSLPKARSETVWTADFLFCIQFHISLWFFWLWHLFPLVGTALHLWYFSCGDFLSRINRWNSYLGEMSDIIQASSFPFSHICPDALGLSLSFWKKMTLAVELRIWDRSYLISSCNYIFSVSADTNPLKL